MKLIFKKLLVMVAVIGAVIVLASCNKKTHSLELPEHVTANVDSYTAIKDNALVTLTITVPVGQELISLKVNGEEVEVSNNRYSFRIKQNTVVTVTFSELENRYSLTLPSGVTADVTSFTDILENTSITLTVLPPANKRLETLKVNDATVVVTNNKYTFNITQNTVVSVVFVDITPVTTTYALNLPGSVVSNQSNDAAIPANTSVTLTITPPANHLVNQLLINGTPVTVTNNQYTFVITEETDVSITFTEVPQTVTTYSLTLPATVTAPDISNLNEIPEDTTVVLTITPPEGKIIDSFKVNGSEVAVVGNAYQFDIAENTVITVTYKDRVGEVNWEAVNPVMNATIINGLNYGIYREGTFDFTSIVTENETILTSTFLYRYNNKLDMTDGYIRREHAPTFVEEVYFDQPYVYFKDMVYDIHGNVASTDRTVQLWDMKAQALETFGFSFLMPHMSDFDSFYMPTGPYSANEFIHQAFLEILLDMAALPDAEQPFTIYEKEGDYKLVLTLNHVNNQEYQEVFKAFDLLDIYYMGGIYDYTIEITFVNNQIDQLTVLFENFFQTVEQTLIYTNATIDAPTDLGSYVKNFTTSTITLHIGDEVITTLLDHYNIADFVGVGSFGEEIHDLVMHLFTPYVEGYVVEGYYLDEQLTIKAEITDFLNDIDLYFKWKTPETLETVLENFYFSDSGNTYLSLLGVVEQSIYFEGEEGIVFSLSEDEYYYYDKATQQLFEITLEPTVVATLSHDSWVYNSLDGVLQVFKYNIAITPKHNFVHDGWADIVIFNETGLLMGTTSFGVLPDIYIKNPNSFDFIETYDAIVDAALNPEIDEMTYYQLLTWDYFQDIRTLDDDMLFLVHFMSGNSSYMTLKKMKSSGLIDYILPTEDNGYTFTLIENEIPNVFDEYKFYDSQKGKIVAMKGSGDYEYLNDMVDLPEIVNDHDFLDAVGYYVNNLYDVDTIQELRDLHAFDKVYLLTYRYELKPYATLLSDLDDQGNIVIHGYNYDIYYKINSDYFLLRLSGYYDDAILSVTETEFKMYNADQYIEVGLENIDLSTLNNRVLWNMFGYNFSQDELDNFVRMLDVFSNQVPHDVIDGKYEFDNDSTIYFEMGRMFIESGPYVFEIASTLEDVSNVFIPNYNYFITIESDQKPDIVLKSENFNNIIYPNGTINYSDYVLVAFYEIIEGVREVDPYDVYSYAGGTLHLYADLTKIITIEELQEKFLTNDKYILRGSDSEIKVVKDEAIYIYIEEELVYYLDTVNEAAYQLSGDTLYRLFEYDVIFNFDTFFQNLNAADFISNGADRYYYNGTYPYLMYMDLYFDNETIALNVGPASYDDTYTFVAEDFIAPGINVGTAVDEEIVKTIFHTFTDFVDLKYSSIEWLLSFELVSNAGQIYYYEYNEFVSKYEASFDVDGFNTTFSYNLGSGLVTVLLTDIGVYIYNTDDDAVLISMDMGQAFNLYEIDALPLGEFGFSFITGWTAYGDPVDLDALRDERESNEIYITPIIENMTVLEAIDQIQEKLYLKVNFISQAMSSWGAFYYDYEDDVAYFEVWSSPFPWFITFDDNQITITKNDYSFITTVDTYNLDIDPHDPGLPFNYFNEVIQSMVELRAFIDGDFVIESSNQWGYTFFEDGNSFAALGAYAFYTHGGLYSLELWIHDTKPQG